MKYSLYLLFALLCVSCYEDEGNYTYKEINQLTAINGMDSTYIKDQFDTLFITPTLNGTLYSDINRFSFEWEIDRKVVSNESQLSYVINLAPSTSPRFCRLTITDKDLETKAFYQFKLMVSSATAGDAMVVLSNYENQAELSFLRLKEGSNFAVNYYQSVAGKPLGTGPKKMYRQYKNVDWNGNISYLDANYGFQVLLNEGLKAMKEDKMVEEDGPTFLDESFFTRINPSYLPLTFTDFKVEGVEHSIPQHISDMFGAMITSNTMMVSGGRFYMVVHGFTGNVALGANLASPYGGYLSPVIFYPYKLPAPMPNQGYSLADYRMVFDETYGRFAFRNFINGELQKIDELPAYPGYRLIYASHTRDKNICLLVLQQGDSYRMLLMNAPGSNVEWKGNQTTSPMPFAILGDVDVSSLINEKTRFYTMAYEPYTFFTTGTKLYKFNHLNLQTGMGPGLSSGVADLADYGYKDGAEITCMCFSRTEKTVLMGISRYGADIEGMSEELKGDLLRIDAETYQLKNKYTGISGYPVDVMVKYQGFYRDGKDDSGRVMDNI